MFTNYYDKILFGISLIILIGFSIVFYQRSQQVIEELETDLPPPRVDNVYELTPDTPLELEPSFWSAPGPQSPGQAWVYDVFTPPSIYYNEADDRFVSEPPGIEARDEEVLAVEFVEFRRAPFRIQLTGQAGSEGEYTLMFRNVETGRYYVTRLGRTLDEVDVEIIDFNIIREEVNGVVGRTSKAVILDQRSGEEVTLIQGETKYTDEPAIFVRTNEQPPRTINARLGEVFEVGEHTYRVEDFTLEPPEVILIKTSPDREEPERSSLSPGQSF